eukprot:COSAG06_NODE_57111_length_281_cov_1.362637_1_plen_47_part_10
MFSTKIARFKKGRFFPHRGDGRRPEWFVRHPKGATIRRGRIRSLGSW